MHPNKRVRLLSSLIGIESHIAIDRTHDGGIVDDDVPRTETAVAGNSDRARIGGSDILTDRHSPIRIETDVDARRSRDAARISDGSRVEREVAR